MKKIFFLLAILPSVILVHAQAKNFVINGKVSGISDGDVKITTTSEDHRVIAAGTTQNGNFSVQGSIPEPGLYFIVMGTEQPQYIFLENTPITITGTKADIKNIKVEGSASH